MRVKGNVPPLSSCGAVRGLQWAQLIVHSLALCPALPLSAPGPSIISESAFPGGAPGMLPTEALGKAVGAWAGAPPSTDPWREGTHAGDTELGGAGPEHLSRVWSLCTLASRASSLDVPACVHVCVHGHTRVYMHTGVCAHVHACSCAYVHRCACEYMYMLVHTGACAHTCLFMCACTHMCLCSCVHACTHVSVCMCAHTCLCSCVHVCTWHVCAVHVCTHGCMCTGVCTCSCVYVCMCVYACMLCLRRALPSVGLGCGDPSGACSVVPQCTGMRSEEEVGAFGS